MFDKWKNPADKDYLEDLAPVIHAIEEAMAGAQIRQAAGREADPAFMKSLLGISDKTEVAASVDTPGTDALSKVFDQLKATRKKPGEE